MDNVILQEYAETTVTLRYTNNNEYHYLLQNFSAKIITFFKTDRVLEFEKILNSTTVKKF